MTSGRDHVALLTRGVSLPEKPLSIRHLGVIADAICSAWGEVLAKWSDQAATGLERDVNAALISHLKIACRSPSPFRTLVAAVDRGTEDYNFDGTRIENRPDINFALTQRVSGFPFVGECKIIDAGSGRTVAKYDIQGLQRFVKGDYAWFNSQAVMIAYVRDATRIEDAIGRLTGSPPTRWPTGSGRHVMTSHGRTFGYIDRGPDVASPGAIDVLHIWLDVPGPIARRPKTR